MNQNSIFLILVVTICLGFLACVAGAVISMILQIPVNPAFTWLTITGTFIAGGIVGWLFPKTS